jgi:nucleotide-binding universal stress UspA family protein
MSRPRSSIVCGVHDAEGCRSAARVAAELAAALDVRLVVAHAVPDDPTPWAHGDARDRGLQRDRAVRRGHRLLEDACLGLDAVLRVMLGDPADELHTVCVEEDAELVVVGSHRHAAPAATRLGRVAARVASSAVCPVVIVPPGAREHVTRTEPGGSIVCGFDGSSGSERALGVAVGLAERVGLEPLAIFVDPARTRNEPAPSPVRVLAGDPARELRERASRPDARLLAVGSRGRGASQGALLGSVAAALAATAPIPVLVVPPTARVGELLAALPGQAGRNGRPPCAT